MKKQNAVAFFLFLLILPFSSATASNFAIELKNGAVFITPQHWEENGQIKCHLFGGIAGFDKQHVKSITPTTAATDATYPTPQDDNDSQQALSTGGNIEVSLSLPLPDAEKAAKLGYIPVTLRNQYLVQRDAILDKMKQVREDITMARQAELRDRQNEFEKTFISLSKEYQTLFEDAVKANRGTPPDWWPHLWPNDLKF